MQYLSAVSVFIFLPPWLAQIQTRPLGFVPGLRVLVDMVHRKPLLPNHRL